MAKKSIFKDYVKYLKHNPEGYWFKRKLFGWGWMPVTWQGWSVTLLFVLIIVSAAVTLLSNESPSSQDMTLFFSILIGSILILIAICYKTGEKPKWTWGKIN